MVYGWGIWEEKKGAFVDVAEENWPNNNMHIIGAYVHLIQNEKVAGGKLYLF